MDRERTVFLVCAAVVAVHIVDDSFVNPSAGTSAGDHLVSGLVPLAGISVGALLYVRSRPGARAVIAILLGLFAIAVSSEAYAYTTRVGASGDDFTGWLCVPAGVVLLGLAAVVLWRSRKQTGPWWRRYVRRAAVGLLSLVLLLGLVIPFVSTYGYTHIARPEVPEPELGGADHEDVSFETSDGLELEGWYIPSENGAAVIAFAGRSRPRPHARYLSEQGYGVLLFDRRGEGDSDGDPNAFGWGGGKDIEAAIDFLQDRPDVEDGRIGAIGFSVGGELLLEVAAGTDDLAAVVSEGAGIRSVREAAELDGGWPALPTWGAYTLGTALFSNHPPPPSLKELVEEVSPTPVFLIYAERGQGGEELSEEYFDVAGDPKQLWVTESAHVGGYDADPEEYARRIVAFFDEHLQPTGSGSQ